MPSAIACAQKPIWYNLATQRGRVTVSRQAHNLEIAGSIPASATSKADASAWLNRVMRRILQQSNKGSILDFIAKKI